MVPKIIYQTHEPDFKNLPEIYQFNSKTWSVLNPGYQHIYMNAEERRDYVKNNSELHLLKFYDSVSGMFQADIWRYLILYDNGGIYADMDSICKMSISTLLENNKDYDPNKHEIVCTAVNEHEHIITKEGEYIPNCLWINNANFAAKKQSSILSLIVDEIDRKSKIAKYDNNGIANFGLGPQIFNKYLLSNDDKFIPILHNACEHGEHLKYPKKQIYSFVTERILKGDFPVNFLGTEIKYSSLLKLKNITL